MKRYALLIGIDQYPDAPLNCCCCDAKAMRAVLNNDFDEIILLTNQDATASAIASAWNNLREKMCHGDLFLFYFSGHGEEQNDIPGFWAWDGFISNKDIERLTNKIYINRLFIFDCCRVSFYTAGKIEYNPLPAIVPTSLPTVIAPVILSACCSDRVAIESGKLLHGVFTDKILSALKDKNITCFKDFLEKLRKANINPPPQFTGSANAYISILKKWREKENLPMILPDDYPDNPALYEHLLNHSNDDDAFEALGDAANNGQNVYAQLYLALYYYEAEDDRYREWLQKTTGKGIPGADYWYACTIQAAGEHKKSAEIFLKLARNDHIDAQYQFGLCCRDGKGTNLNKQDSFFWIKKAADSGHAEAINTISRFYQEGIGHPKDIFKSKQYLMKYKMLQAKKCADDMINSPRDFFEDAISHAKTVAQTTFNNTIKQADSIAKNTQELVKKKICQTKKLIDKKLNK
ncbi:MAG: hypothetical protein E7056_03225 [Lentisphaerae bacterium]|nr:hypothetical protein [Lentisphaerota bacterium]